MGDNSDIKPMYSCDDYAKIFGCGKRKARLLMERAGVVKVGRVPMVTADNHKKFMTAGDFSVHWPKRFERMIKDSNPVDGHSGTGK